MSILSYNPIYDGLLEPKKYQDCNISKKIVVTKKVLLERSV